MDPNGLVGLVAPGFGHRRLDFRLQGDELAAYVIERSEDLSSWTEVPATEVRLAAPERARLIQVPMDGAPRQFVRARLMGPLRVPEIWDDVSIRAGIIVATRQDWGVLGLGTSAHAQNARGLPLRIGSRQYTHGLGHHADGGILLLLDGEYDRFEAELGTQPCPGGSVAFRVFVDGELRFDSGILRSGSEPLPVSIGVEGGYEMRLDANDAGNGIGCDMANWANARLRRVWSGPVLVGEPRVEIGAFGQIATWDPTWKEGSRAIRYEEFPANDVFLERELVPDAEGCFDVPVSTNLLACIGIEWRNRRAVHELRLDFADPADVPPPDAIHVEAWFGASRWQGDWMPLEGEWALEGSGLVFRASRRTPPGCGLAGCLADWSGSDSAPLMTRKIRWIWPVTSEGVRVFRPGAITRSRWATANLQVEVAADAVQDGVELRLEDGAWLHPSPVPVPDDRGGDAHGHHLDAGRTATFSLRYALPSVLRSELTKIHVRRGEAAAAILVEDVLRQPCVYVRDLGILVCRAEAPVRLADYQREIADRTTLLEQVRLLPDQTREQAMEHTHRVAQHEGPVMLSLVAENDKLVVSRAGDVYFLTTPITELPWTDHASRFSLSLSAPEVRWRARRLEGGWLPVPVIEHESANARLTQRTFVAPLDADAPDPARLGRHSVGVVQLELERTAQAGQLPEVTLTFEANELLCPDAVIEPRPYGFVVQNAGRPLAYVARHATTDELPTLAGKSLRFRGSSLLPGGDRWTLYLLPASRPAVLDPPFPDPHVLFRAVETYWSAVMSRATLIWTPDTFLNQLIRSLRVRCLIAARMDEASGTFAPWVAAMHYGPSYLDCESYAVVRGMDFLGHADFARRAIEYLMRHYTSAGYLTTGYTTFGTSRHLETVADHYGLTGNRWWFEQNAPEFKRVAHWIVSQTRKTMRVIPTEDGVRQAAGYGLMPPAVLADGSGFAMHFALNGYYASALRGLGEALETIGDPEGAFFRSQGEQLANRTAQQWLDTARRSPVVPLRNGEWVGYYPSQLHTPGQSGDYYPPLARSEGFVFLELPTPGVRRMFAFFAGEDAGRGWSYDIEAGAHHLVPTGVLAHDDPRVSDMLDHLEDVQFLRDGWFDYPATENERDWFNLGGFAKVQPYYARNGDLYALRDDVKPFLRSYFNSMAAMVNPEVMTFWEHFQHTAAWDKTHEAGQFLHQTRTMLLMERGPTLWLAPLISTNWLAHNRTVVVKRAPTRFGPVSYRLTSQVAEHRMTAVINAPLDPRLEQVILRARHPGGRPVRAVTVNGIEHHDFDTAKETVHLPAGIPFLHVELGYDPPAEEAAIRASSGQTEGGRH